MVVCSVVQCCQLTESVGSIQVLSSADLDTCLNTYIILLVLCHARVDVLAIAKWSLCRGCHKFVVHPEMCTHDSQPLTALTSSRAMV